MDDLTLLVFDYVQTDKGFAVMPSGVKACRND